jgi:hypothetical protein
LSKLKLILLILLVLDAGISYSQSESNGFFNIQSVSGEIKLKGLYREQKSQIGDIKEDQKSTYFLGGVMLNTASYFWNPDLIMINLDGEYNPETRHETYLLIPDRSEVRTLKKIDFRTSVFRNKSISLNTFVNLNQTYYNRELLTNIKSDSRQWGGLLSFNNKFLPMSVSYRKTDWLQKELQTGRNFTMRQSNLLGRVSKSFGDNDLHEILYSRDDYTYNYAGSKEVSNLIDKVALNNNLFFDRERKFNFNSQVSYYNQAGDNQFSKVEAIERLMFNLPANFRLIGGYTYHRLNDPYQLLSQNRINGSLTHQLFESLTSNIFIDYSGIKQTIYDEKNLKAGFDFNYTKKIPAGGRINLGYRYFRSYFDMTGVSAPVKIINEEHILSDAKIVLLNKPYIDLATLTVKDQSGVIIYQLNFDYTVTVRNNFIEIQRVPGGQIADSQAITADYTATQPGSYSFEADNNTFSSSIQLFKKLIEIYYRGSVQDYRKQVETEFLTLNYYTQNVYGGRIDIGFAGFGAEYDNYRSNIVPYKRYRYYIDLNWSIRSKFLVSVNGNIMDYKLIDNDVNQLHSNITGKITYNLTYRTRIDLEAGYLKQTGRNIDLDLLTSKLEISTSFRQLYLKGGVEMYRRHYLKSDFAFVGTFVEMVRKF